MKLELISFALCPFVQRSVITLKVKGAPYDITYIDLAEPPAWFEKISPLGQVPLLKVDGKTVIFESAVINEFIDETVGTPLHSKDPLQKAFERAWIEYSSSLLIGSYQMMHESDSGKLDGLKGEFFADLARLEDVVSSGPYFRGADFSLVDAAYAPLFMRLFLSDILAKDPAWKSVPKTRAWADALMLVPAVHDSVLPTFAAEFVGFLKEVGSPLV